MLSLNAPPERGGARHEGRGKDRKLKRGFLGMNFPRNARARGSSAGVLGKDRIKVNLMGREISMILGGPLPGKLPDRTLIEGGWPGYNGLLQEEWRVSNHGNKADPYLHEIMSQ